MVVWPLLRFRSQARFETLEPLHKGVRERVGASVKKIAESLMIRHDHGSQYTADDFQDELRFLGMIASPSFARDPQGNGTPLCGQDIRRLLRSMK